jgi:hypothetical protein
MLPRALDKQTQTLFRFEYQFFRLFAFGEINEGQDNTSNNEGLTVFSVLDCSGNVSAPLA